MQLELSESNVHFKAILSWPNYEIRDIIIKLPSGFERYRLSPDSCIQDYFHLFSNYLKLMQNNINVKESVNIH